MHGPHSPTAHTTASAGHGNRLHGADVVGGVNPASAHSLYGTIVATRVTWSVLTHIGGEHVVKPSTRGSVVAVWLPTPRLSHGALHALQSLDGSHASVGHGCVLQDD